jgi:hypothetical protein
VHASAMPSPSLTARERFSDSRGGVGDPMGASMGHEGGAGEEGGIGSSMDGDEDYDDFVITSDEDDAILFDFLITEAGGVGGSHLSEFEPTKQAAPKPRNSRSSTAVARSSTAVARSSTAVARSSAARSRMSRLSKATGRRSSLSLDGRRQPSEMQSISEEGDGDGSARPADARQNAPRHSGHGGRPSTRPSSSVGGQMSERAEPEAAFTAASTEMSAREWTQNKGLLEGHLRL